MLAGLEIISSIFCLCCRDQLSRTSLWQSAQLLIIASLGLLAFLYQKIFEKVHNRVTGQVLEFAGVEE